MKKKFVAMLLCVSMTAGLLAGCGSGDGSSDASPMEEQTEDTEAAGEAGAQTETKEESPAEATEGESVTLEILSLKTEEAAQAAFQQMFDNYTAAHPNVTFELQSMSSDDLKTTLRARSASGDMPDIITWMKEVEPEFLEDLSGESFLDGLNADTVAGANAIYDDGIYAMPIDNGYIALYYNKDVLEANSLEAPGTLSELVSCCETLTANGVTPFALSLSNLSVPYMSLIGLFAETVYGADPDWSAKRDAGEVTIAAEDGGWKQAFDILTDVVYKYADPDNAYNNTYEDCAALIANGEVAFYGNGSWALADIRAANPDANIGLMAFPISENQADAKMLCFPDTSLSVCADSGHKDTAKDFLAYVAGEEAGAIWSENVRVSSAVQGVSVAYDPIASDIEAYLSDGQFTPYGDRVLRSVYTDKLWEIFSYYMLGESDWASLSEELDTYWDKARDEEDAAAQ